MTATTRDRKRCKAIRKLLTKPMKTRDIVAHFGGDQRYYRAIHNMVVRGQLLNLEPNPKRAGLFVAIEHAPADAPERPEVEHKRRGRPPGAVKPLVLDFQTGAHLQQVWGGKVWVCKGCAG